MWCLHVIIVIWVYLMVWTQSLRISDKTSMFPPKTCVAFQDKVKKTTLSNNNIKCGELFIGYSKINCITNYTTTEKYCKLINCLAWWRWMSPTAPVVPFSNLLATVFFKKNYSLKKSRVWCNWCVLCRRIKRESILSLCEPRNLI